MVGSENVTIEIFNSKLICGHLRGEEDLLIFQGHFGHGQALTA